MSEYVLENIAMESAAILNMNEAGAHEPLWPFIRLLHNLQDVKLLKPFFSTVWLRKHCNSETTFYRYN